MKKSVPLYGLSTENAPSESGFCTALCHLFNTWGFRAREIDWRRSRVTKNFFDPLVFLRQSISRTRKPPSTKNQPILRKKFFSKNLPKKGQKSGFFWDTLYRKKSSKNIIVSIQICIEIQGICIEFYIEKIKILKKFAKLFLVAIFYNFGLKIFLKC